MKKSILLYGILSAGLVLVLQAVNYKFLFNDIRLEIFVGFMAVLFTAFGVWMANQIISRKKIIVEVPVEVHIPTPYPTIQARMPEELGLSKREAEVLSLMAEGLSNQEIADKLFLSLPTVKKHSSNVLQKLDVKRRTQAIEKARQIGLLP